VCVKGSVLVEYLENLGHYILEEKTEIEDEGFPRKNGKGSAIFWIDEIQVRCWCFS
jgi:hypothetical protein